MKQDPFYFTMAAGLVGSFSLYKFIGYCCRRISLSREMDQASKAPEYTVEQSIKQGKQLAGQRVCVTGKVKHSKGKQLYSKLQKNTGLIVQVNSKQQQYSNDFLRPYYKQKPTFSQQLPLRRVDSFLLAGIADAKAVIPVNLDVQDNSKLYQPVRLIASKLQKRGLTVKQWLSNLVMALLGVFFRFSDRFVRGGHVGLREDQFGISIGTELTVLATLRYNPNTSQVELGFVDKMFTSKTGLIQDLQWDLGVNKVFLTMSGVVAGCCCIYLGRRAYLYFQRRNNRQ